ncbi:sulfotransferase 1C2A-like [Mercenaria mercenaria]|uniref:sulfotransferase 1C2A-like n=1 Tax=Mercenaria mercenaria TaxID=6596 RepID=UPI00234E6D8B|nr:sulfotransferase 1C2A-like [Mercenaria mercenaria]
MLFEDEEEGFKVLELDGTVFPTPLFKTEAELQQRFSYVKNLPYKAGDVLLCSYPKTGTHWTMNLLHYLMFDGDLDDTMSYPPVVIDFFDIEGEVQREGRRILMSHFPPKRLPIEHFANGGKTILVFGDFKLSWEKLLKYWLQGKFPLGSYFEYYNSWQEEINRKPDLDILIVQYEDLKRNSLQEVRRIQKYLCLNHSDERLEAVLKKCSLETLKADVDSGKVKTRLIDEDGKSVLYRKGIIGDWKNQFTVAQNEMFESIVNEKLHNSIFNYKSWN